jgi:hypothetical protein
VEFIDLVVRLASPNVSSEIDVIARKTCAKTAPQLESVGDPPSPRLRREQPDLFRNEFAESGEQG